MNRPSLAVRIKRTNPNHHLWENHGTWWMHYTVHLPDFTKRRVRRSLEYPLHQHRPATAGRAVGCMTHLPFSNDLHSWLRCTNLQCS
jgi:hypothetical protein